jgi:hypothetical protein
LGSRTKPLPNRMLAGRWLLPAPLDADHPEVAAGHLDPLLS